MDIVAQLQQAAAAAVQSEYGLEVDAKSLVIQRTSKEHQGDFTIVIFPLMKHKLGGLPQVGKALGEFIVSHLPQAASFELIKGFLNITLTPHYWVSLLGKLTKSGERYYQLATKDELAVIEYPSPNTNKPLHLGHLRNIFLGNAVTNILRAAGYPTQVVCLYNDKGIHICKSMLAWQRFGNGETPDSSGIKGDHLVGKYYVAFDKAYREEIKNLVAGGMDEETAKKEAPLLKEAQDMYRKWEAGDEEVVALWKQMNSWVYAGVNQTYARLGVEVDKNYYESDTYLLGKELVTEGLEKEVCYQTEDGAVWVNLEDAKLDKKLLLRSDGTSLYITQDLGSADLRYQDFKMQRSIYVIGNEQDYHMNVLKEVLKRLDREYAAGIYHLSYGMVDLPTGKMKSREGTVVDADDLIDEMIATAKTATEELGKTEGMEENDLKALYEMLALGAVKYFLLKVEPAKRMLFNPEESIDFKGHTGTFIQYTHARIQGILRKAEQLQLKTGVVARYEPHELEVALLHRLLSFPATLAEAANQYNPGLIAAFAYELSKDYSRFHYEVPVLKAESETALSFRIQLNKLVAMGLAKSMALLGIQVPQRM